MGGHALTIEVEGYDGSLTASFDATGFGSLGHACPNAENVKQETTTTFCGSRQCGFFEGVFCGICDIATANPRYTLHSEESPVFRVDTSDVPVGGEISFETSDSTQVAVTAHVGPERTLVKPGSSFEGVSVDSSSVVRVAAGSVAQELLLHVVPRSPLTATWVRLIGSLETPYRY